MVEQANFYSKPIGGAPARDLRHALRPLLATYQISSSTSAKCIFSCDNCQVAMKSLRCRDQVYLVILKNRQWASSPNSIAEATRIAVRGHSTPTRLLKNLLRCSTLRSPRMYSSHSVVMSCKNPLRLQAVRPRGVRCPSPAAQMNEARPTRQRALPRIFGFAGSKKSPDTFCAVYSRPKRFKMLLVMRTTVGSLPARPCAQSVLPTVMTVPPRV